MPRTINARVAMILCVLGFAFCVRADDKSPPGPADLFQPGSNWTGTEQGDQRKPDTHQARDFHAELKVVDRKITEIETLVARKQMTSILNTDNLTGVRPIFSETVPEADRPSRAEMISLVGHYFDGIEQGNGANPKKTETYESSLN